MKRPFAPMLALAWTITTAAGAATPDCAELRGYDAARAIVRDLGRITAPTGVQESFKARIGGVDQWFAVRGQDRANPVIVFVHGGPASPTTPSTWQFQRPLEEYFTIVHYDQRGAGRSYLETDPDDVRATLTIERYVDDAIEVAELARKRYAQRKVILVGHSWGTIVGLRAALKRPDLFHAYVGIGQVIDTRTNERLSYDYGLAQAKAHGNAAAVAEMATIAPYPGDAPITRERIVIARKWAQYYGGLSAFRDDSTYYFDAAKLSPEYDAAAACAIDRGNALTLAKVLPEFLDVDFTGVRRFPIPIVMFMGRHDYTTPSAPTAQWLSAVDAPYKRAVWFERSAHLIPWEEPGKTLVSLLETVRPIATGASASATR